MHTLTVVSPTIMILPRFVLVSNHNNQQQASLLHMSNREGPVPYPLILPTLSFGQVTAPVHEINSTDTTRVETRQRDQKEGVGAVKRGGAMLRRQKSAEEGYRIIYPDQEVDTNEKIHVS